MSVAVSAMDRQAALAAAIGAALRGDPALAQLVGARVYDAPPARAATPSVTIRLVSARDGSTADTEAQLLTFDLDVWDRYEAGATLARPRAVMGHLRRILHMQPIPVPGAALLSLLCVGARGPARDPDERTLHGTVTVAALAGHEAPLS